MAPVGLLRTVAGPRRTRALAAAALAALALGSPSPVGGDDPWRDSGEWWRTPIRGTEHRVLVHAETGEKTFAAPDGRRFPSTEAAARAEAALLPREEVVAGPDLRAAAADDKRREAPVPIVLVLGSQPLHAAGQAARDRHAPRFATLLREQRAILGSLAKRRPADGVVHAQAGERAAEERSLLSEEERERIRVLREEMLALRRRMRREVLDEARPVVAREQEPVVAWIESRGGRVLSRHAILNAVTARMTPRAAMEAVDALPAVRRIEIAGVNEVGLDVSVPAIGASSWHTASYDGSSSTKVCVIDTGIDSGHPALDNGIVSDAAVFLGTAQNASNFNDDASSVDDLQFHGTHVGGIVMSNDDSGSLDGVAPGGRLMNGKAGYRTTSGGGSLFDPDIMDAGDWAADNGADAINCSFGGGATTNGNSALALFFDALVHDLNIGVAVSAGNSGSGAGTILTPADGFNVVTVGNYDDNGTVSDSDDAITGSSSRGPCSDGRRKPDLSAPGTNIGSCYHLWETSADFVSATGTSMSAPHVAGALCILEDFGSSWAPEAMKALLLTNVRNSGNFPTTPDNNHGHGGLNLATAFTNRTCVIEGTLSSSSVAFYRSGALAANERVTLCWNRQVVSNNDSTPGTFYSLVDLDLALYDESDGSAEGSSASAINSVEQLKAASALSSPVIKVKRAASFPSGVSSQDFAVAAEDDGTLSSVAAPSLTAVYTASPTLLTGSKDFTVTVRVDNGGGLPAFAPSVTLTLPSGYSIQSGANPQTLSTINGSASGTATWTVRSASTGTSGPRTLQVAAASSSFGETWATGTVSSNHDLDLQAPTGSVTIAAGAEFVPGTTVDLSVGADDDLSGADQMRFSNDGTTFSAWEDLSPTKSWVLASGADGTRTVRVQFRDAAGNESGSFTDDTTLDATAPAGSVVAAGGAAWSNTRSITLTTSATDALSGVSMMRFGSDGVTWRPWQPYATSAAFLLAAGDGAKTVHAQFQDVAGNVSTTVTDGIGLDETAPSGTVSVAGGATYAVTGTVSLGLSATDALSGVSKMRFSNDGTSFSAWMDYATSTSWALSANDGAKTVHAEFQDAAGNVSAPATDGVIRDGTPPSGSVSIAGGTTATNLNLVTLTLSATDPVAGVDQMRLRNGTGTWGAFQPYATSLDWTLPSGDGAKTVGVQFSDNAGNVSAETTDSILLDQTAPTGSVAILNGKAATNGTAVTVDVGYSDNLSGVVLVRLSNDGGANWGAWTGPTSPLAWDLAAGEGTRTVHYQMRDGAGNVSTPIFDTIQVDLTQPTGTFTLNGDRRYLLGSSPLVAETVSDDGASGSGVVEFRVSHDAGASWSDWLPIGTGDVEIPRPAGRGLRTVRGEFRDLAGNSSAAFDETIHLVEDAPQSLSAAKKLLGSLAEGGDVDSFVVDLVAGDALSLKARAKALQKGVKVTLGFDLFSPSGAPIFEGRFPATLKAPGVSKFVATETGPHTVILRSEGATVDAAANYALGVKVKAAKANLSAAGSTTTGIVPFTAARGGTLTGKLTGNVVPPILVAPATGVPLPADILTKGTVHTLLPVPLDGSTGAWEIRFASVGPVTYAIKVIPAKRLVLPEDPDAAMP